MKFNELLYFSRKLNSQIKHGNFYRVVSAAAVLSVMLGTLALLISMSVLQGFEEQLASTAVNFTSHIKIEKYENIPIDNFSDKINIIKSHFPGIKSIAPYIQKEALISTKSNVDGIVLKGEFSENESTGISKKITRGQFPSARKDGFQPSNINDNTNININIVNSGIIIGERLAKKINANVGDSVIIYLLKSSNSSALSSEIPDVFKVPITGLYRTGMAKYDDIVAYCDISYLASILGISGNICSGLDIMLNNPNEISQTTIDIEKFLKFPYSVLSVYDLHGSMFAWIDMQKEPIPLVLGLISLVAVMNIITILLILIVEKTHTIGILRTLGMKSSSILAIFLIRGTGIGIAGTTLGSGLAYLLTYLQQEYQLIRLKGEIYFLDVLPISIDWHNYLIVGSVSIAIAFLITLLPAIAALKVKPIKAINFK